MDKKDFPEIFDIFNGKKPISPVSFSRIPMFDPVSRVDKSNGQILVQKWKYNYNYITIKRPELSIVDQKIFYTLLKAGEFIKKTEESYVFRYNFANFKKIAGINPTTKWTDVEKSLERLTEISLLIENKNPEGEYKRLFVMTHIINKFEVVESEKEIWFETRFSKEFVELLKTVILFNISLHQLEELNKIKNPIIYRLISFFITQHKKQSWELFSLLAHLTPMKFDTRKKRHRILKSIQENEEILKHYGITTVEEKKGKFKTYILSYKKPKNLNIELGKHIPVEV